MFNGLQLMHLAKRIDPSIQVIAMSGFDDAALRAEAESAGALFLHKPIDVNELRRRLG